MAIGNFFFLNDIDIKYQFNYDCKIIKILKLYFKNKIIVQLFYSFIVFIQSKQQKKLK